MIKINNYIIEQNHFPDNTLRVNAIDGFTPSYITWLYENDAELFTLICIRRHYENSPLTLYMPYCPHARMDRVKKDTDVFTLKYFCEVINSLNFEKAYITDAHSNVAPALLDRCVNVNVKDKIKKVIDLINDESLVAFYPDEGAMKRYSDQNTLPYAFGVKVRDWSTGKIQKLDIIDNGIRIRDNAVLIIDDICSYGGTFVRAAQALKDAGAKAIYLYITHCETNIYLGNIFNQKPCLIDAIYTASTPNSIFHPNLEFEKINGVKIYHSI